MIIRLDTSCDSRSAVIRFWSSRAGTESSSMSSGSDTFIWRDPLIRMSTRSNESSVADSRFASVRRSRKSPAK